MFDIVRGITPDLAFMPCPPVNTGEFVLHCRRSWHLDMGSGTSFLTDTFHPPPPLLLAHVGLPQQTPTLPAFFTPALAQRILLAGKLLHLLRSAPRTSDRQSLVESACTHNTTEHAKRI